MATWPKIFKNHPSVNFCYSYDISPWGDKTEFLNKFNEVYILEGYDSFFYKNKVHLITNFKRQLNIKSSNLACMRRGGATPGKKKASTTSIPPKLKINITAWIFSPITAAADYTSDTPGAMY